MKFKFIYRVILLTILAITVSFSLIACGQEDIATERRGPDGEYDQSALAKKVLNDFKDNSDLGNISTVYVAQSGSTIILKGTVSNQETLEKMVSIAEGVDGVTAVESSQVTVQ